MTEKIRDKHDIKAALQRAGMTLTRLAEMNGLNPNSFRAVWSRTNRPAEAAIASFLEQPVEQLFPDRYPIRTTRILDTKYLDTKASRKSAGGTNKVAA